MIDSFNTTIALLFIFACVLLFMFLVTSRGGKKDIEKVDSGFDGLQKKFDELRNERDDYAYTLMSLLYAAEDVEPVEGFEKVQLMSARSRLKRIRKIARETICAYNSIDIVHLEQDEAHE